MVLEALAEDLGVARFSRACQSLVAAADLGSRRIVLARPQTFMNSSGAAARELLDEFGLPAQALVVVLDDLHLPFGKLRIRPRGSSGGHLGLESVLEATGSREIVRVRVGIGEEKIPEDWREFVLAEFPAALRPELDALIAKARDAVKAILAVGVERAMSRYNG